MYLVITDEGIVYVFLANTEEEARTIAGANTRLNLDYVKFVRIEKPYVAIGARVQFRSL